MRYDPRENTVTIFPLSSEGNAPIVMEVLEFISRLVLHIPDVRERQVTYYGPYANASRYRRLKRAFSGDNVGFVPLSELEEPTPFELRRRIRWAQLIKQVWLEDPLLCPHCGQEMRIISFITDPLVVDKILRHIQWHPGEPAGQTVLDRWSGSRYLWHLMLTQQGYLVMSVDNRGTPAPRGRQWRKLVWVGIWGWSGGGSMSLNAIFRYPDLYHTAMSVAPVTNQRYYDTIYQERYMGLPQDNPEGYRLGSPSTFAHQLEGNLLDLVNGVSAVLGETELTLDFDAGQSVRQVSQGQNPKYKLQPTIRVVQTVLSGTISGTVTPTGIDALVVALTAGTTDTVTSTYTDAETGGYVLQALLESSYDVVAGAAGYQDSTINGIVVTAGQDNNGNDFGLIKSGGM
jgi:hypothetical protein